MELDFELGDVRPSGVYAAIEINMERAPFSGDDIGCPTCYQPVLGITTFHPGSRRVQGYDDGVYRAASGFS